MFVQYFFNKTAFRFIIVGIINTIVGTGIMFVFYNVFHLSYWISSAANYFFCSILSYFLNKVYTFEYKKKDWQSILRFTCNILVCYFIAYGCAKPVAIFLLENTTTHIQENVAMIIGMGLFVVLNYIGQRFYAFRK